MAVHLHETLEKIPGWREAAEYANTHLTDHALEGYEIYVRHATEIEERRFTKDNGGEVSLQFDPEQNRFDLVFSLADHMSYEEMQRLFASTGIPIGGAALIDMWMSQGNISDPAAFAEAQILAAVSGVLDVDEDEEYDE